MTCKVGWMWIDKDGRHTPKVVRMTKKETKFLDYGIRSKTIELVFLP